jgi:hypothetical protein
MNHSNYDKRTILKKAFTIQIVCLDKTMRTEHFEKLDIEVKLLKKHRYICYYKYTMYGV